MLRVLALTLLIVSLMPPVAMGGQADLILLGGRVLTMDSDRQVVEAVAITGEQVRALGSNQEIQRLSGPQTRTVDLRGRTVIPGLIDAHVHLLIAQQIVDEASLKDYRGAVLPQMLMGFLEHGITTVRSATDPWPHIAEVRDQLEKGTLKGPRLVIVGPSLTAPNGHPIPAVCRTNLFCRDRAVREVATGGSMLGVAVDGLGRFAISRQVASRCGI
jgi:imidazolonepropionase-like amidohydrolase